MKIFFFVVVVISGLGLLWWSLTRWSRSQIEGAHLDQRELLDRLRVLAHRQYDDDQEFNARR